MIEKKSKDNFHSGRRLQKLREIGGLELEELAAQVNVTIKMLKDWESKGVPKKHIEPLCHYFEVSRSLFTKPVDSDEEIELLIRKELFALADDEVQQRIQDCIKLQTTSLDLSGLGLREVPQAVFTLLCLNRLDLSDNQITHLPIDFAQLVHLVQLDISDNLLSQIPAMLLGLTNLLELSFAGNPVTDSALKEGGSQLPTLRKYIENSNVTIVVCKERYDKNRLRFEDVREVVESNEPMLLATPDTIHSLVACIKGRVTSIVLVTDQPLTVADLALYDNVLSEVSLNRIPLVCYSSRPPESVKVDYFEQQLTAKLGSACILYHSVHSLDIFDSRYNKVKNNALAESSLPKVKLERLTLINIGVYEQLDIDFRARTTVLIGLNGAGKTTILKAMSLAILGPDNVDESQQLAASLLRIESKHGSQVKRPARGSIKLYASIDGESFSNTVTLVFDSKQTEQVKATGTRFEPLFVKDGQLVSLMLGVGEQRNIRQMGNPLIGAEKRHAKVLDLLPLVNSEEFASIAHFGQWVGNLEVGALNGAEHNRRIIKATFAIFSGLMEEQIRFVELASVNPLEIWVEHQSPRQMVPLSLASQGYQAVMGWVGFVIKRMFEAYENCNDPLSQSAVVLLDEIDQLMHVKWQQRILDIIANEFFPNTQWIVTTHSPIVIAGLDQGQVIQLHQEHDKMVARHNPVDLWLWQYGDIVNYLFDLSPVEPKVDEQQLLDEIEQQSQATGLAEDEKQQRLTKLNIKLGKARESRKFVDELYAEQQKLKQREQELATLIASLQSNGSKV